MWQYNSFTLPLCSARDHRNGKVGKDSDQRFLGMGDKIEREKEISPSLQLVKVAL